MTTPSRSGRVLLEVGVGSVEDALAAQAGGADRLELNAALALGGLTPSPGTLIEVRAATSLSLFVMIRPRQAGFSYKAAEFRVMQRDLAWALDHGADGVVFGILHEDGTIDVPRCRQLLAGAAGRPVVFHRAFDVTPAPFAALEQLIDLGVGRVMTSGQARTALEGAGLIAGLLRRAAGRIEVLPAGGITSANVSDLLTRTGCTQVHCGLRTDWHDPSTTARPQVAFGTRLPSSEEFYPATDPAAVGQMRRLLDGDAGG
jgi:copper homeostasis protein